MEVFPCPLGILALRLCRSVAASKSFGHRGGDFSQLVDERINLFAPFAVPAETEPDDRWKRPQVGLESSSSTTRVSLLKSTADMVKYTDVDYATGSLCSSCSIPPLTAGGLWSNGKGCAMCDYDDDDNCGG